MSLICKTSVVCISTETRINVVIVCRCVTMICALFVSIVRRIVFKNRSKPQCCNTQFCKIIEMLTYSFQVATMTQTRFITITCVFVHAFYLVITLVTIGKTVGHKHVKHIGIIKTLTLASSHFTLKKFVINLLCLLAIGKPKCHLTRLGIFHVKINQKIVCTARTDNTINLDTCIVSCYISRCNTFAIYHELQRRILHTYKPVCRFYFINLYLCTDCHCSKQKA